MALRLGTVLVRSVVWTITVLVAALTLTAGAAQAMGTGTSAPTTVAGLAGVVDLDALGNQTCAVTSDGAVHCWGVVATAPGDQSEVIRTAPVTVGGLSGVVRASGRCAVKGDGTVWCWGPSWLSDAPDPADAPAQKAGISGAVDVDQGEEGVTCVRKGDGTIWCWGYSRWGATGVPSPPNVYQQDDPMQVPSVTGATDLAVGKQHACAVATGGQLWCWGTGPGLASDSTAPAPVSGLANAANVSAAIAQTCTVDTAGAAHCIGDNALGEMGVPPHGDATSTAPIQGLPTMTQVSTGLDHTCGVAASGAGWCWGAQADGRLGNPVYGGDGTSEVPVPVLGLSGIQGFVTGDAHTCALLSDQTVRCFGSDAKGQLGNGDAALPADPAPTSQVVLSSNTPGTSASKGRAVPTISRSGAKITFTKYLLTPKTGQLCPSRATITVRRQARTTGPKIVRHLGTTSRAGACTISGTITLSASLAKRKTLAVIVTGTGLQTRSRALK